jgi:hypothetical protein
VRILLDECVDWRLGRDLGGHDVTAVPAIGWAGIRNGRLLALTQDTFDVLVTVDRKLPLQHDLTQFNVAVVVLRARSNRLADLRTLVPQLLAALASAPKGAATTVAASDTADS